MSGAASDFVHLHVHSDYSLLDGACRIDHLMARAKALGMQAIALTDHGNLFGAVEFYQAAKAAGLKPLIGCEIYLAAGSRLEKTGRDAEGKTTFHMGVIARNLEGYRNLLRLVSDAHVNGFYYRPRADWETLERHAQGLIGFTGCLAALVPQLLMAGDYARAREAVGRFVSILGRENYFVELQDHGIPQQRQIAPDLLKLAREFDLKVVGTNDVHYVNATDAAPHDAMLCIQTGAKVADAERMRFDTQQFFLKSRVEMEDVFRDVPGALTNTAAVAEMCDLELRFGGNNYPVYRLPPEIKTDGVTFLRGLCAAGLRKRYGVEFADPEPARDPAFARQLCERIEYEIGIIQSTGFLDYFLIVWDFIHWAKTRGIPVGPGRGSGAGCLVAYLLEITNIDPIRFKLLFERFLNPERISAPDFDIDFCMRRRGEVVNYVREKYGKECVANIITFGTFGAKGVVRDMARVLGVPYADADRLAKMVPDDLNTTLDDAVTRSAELRTEMEQNPIAKKIVEQGKVIEGMVRNTGKHAAGIIITDRPLSEFVPLTVQEGDITVQFDMKAVEKLGLLKMDFLGLKTLTVIDDAVRNIRLTGTPGFDIDRIPLEDARTFQLLNEGRTVGVFQLESGGMQNLCRQFNISSIDEIVALIALYRPGPMEWIPDYIRGKRDPAAMRFPHPLLEEICRETYGVMVYQEQVMEAAKVIAGYSLGGADILRRAMGKKDPEIMAKQRSVFVEGARRTHDIPERTALEIFAILEKFAGYGFNKSHSAAYAILGYQTGFLKANYPVQFMAAVLSNELGNADKIAHFIAEAASMGIEVLGPDINESRENFTPVIQADRATPPVGPSLAKAAVRDPVGPSLAKAANGVPADAPSPHTNGAHAAHYTGGKIRFGLAAIKGVGDAAAQKILEERDAGGAFKDFRDFIRRVDSRAVNRRVLECLVKTGAFDFTGESRGSLFNRLDAAISDAAARQRDLSQGQDSFLDTLHAEPARITPERAQNDPTKAFPQADMLQYEKELLGFYVTGHPMDAFAGLAEALNTCTEEALATLPDRTEFRLCGVPSGVTKRLSRRDNTPWASFTLATRNGSVPLHCYSDAFAEFGATLQSEAPVLILGTVLNRNGDVRFAAREVHPLARVLPGLVKRITWILRPDGANDAFLHGLRQSLDHQHGDTQLEIGFLVEGDLVGVAEIPAALKWKVDPDEFRRLHRDPAVVGCQIETRALAPAAPRRWGRRNGNGE